MDAGFPTQESQVQNYWVAQDYHPSRFTQTIILQGSLRLSSFLEAKDSGYSKQLSQILFKIQ